MPIYAYKCSACGHAKDVLQKLSDQPLTVCPACGQSAFSKQVTAAGFQLKGSGWYVTDFRNNGGGTAKTSEPSPVVPSTSASGSGAAASAPAAAGTSDSGSSSAPAPAAAPPSPSTSA